VTVFSRTVEKVPDEAPEEGAERPCDGADEGHDEFSGYRHGTRLPRRLPGEHDERDHEQDDLKRREHGQRDGEAECKNGETDDDPMVRTGKERTDRAAPGHQDEHQEAAGIARERPEWGQWKDEKTHGISIFVPYPCASQNK
jgi:hypothetical protein